MGIVIFLLTITVGVLLLRQANTQYHDNVRSLTDTMTAHDKLSTEKIDAIRYRGAIDSMITMTNHNDIVAVYSKVDNITHKYDKERNTVAILSDDEQLALFSEWLSTTDSL